MTSSAQLAKHIREVHFGTNWTWVNLKDLLSDVSWEQAITQVYGLNTIAALVYHIHYYVAAQIQVLEGGSLEAHDKYSFDLPPITSRADWEQLLEKVWSDGEKHAQLVAQLSDDQLWATFEQEKYGNYYRNLLGLIEHTHYHMGQIALLKKILVKER